MKIKVFKHLNFWFWNCKLCDRFGYHRSFEEIWGKVDFHIFAFEPYHNMLKEDIRKSRSF